MKSVSDYQNTQEPSPSFLNTYTLGEYRSFIGKLNGFIEASYQTGNTDVAEGNAYSGMSEDSAINVKKIDWVEGICRLLPVSCILAPGHSPGNPERIPPDLIVIVSAGVKATPAECEAVLSELYKGVRFLVFKSSFLSSVRENQGAYFAEVFRKGRVYYQSRRFLIPAPVYEIARERWDAFSFRAEIAALFLEGARMYLDSGAYRMAAFMSQQVVEHSLLSVMDFAMGVTGRSHKLSRMIRVAGYMFPFIPALFEGEEGELCLKILERSYSRSRYDSGFEIEDSLVGAVVRKAEELLNQVEKNLSERIPPEKDVGKEARLTLAEDETFAKVPEDVLREISLFFDASEHESIRRSLYHVLVAYAGDDFYRHGDPVGVHFVLDNLRNLLSVVQNWVRKEEKSVNISRAGSVKPDVFDPGRLSDQADGLTILTYYFVTYPRWQVMLDSIRFFALCRQSGIEDGAAIDTLKFYHDTGAVIEVCYKLYLRSGEIG